MYLECIFNDILSIDLHLVLKLQLKTHLLCRKACPLSVTTKKEGDCEKSEETTFPGAFTSTPS